MTTPPLTPGQRQALRYASRKGGAHIGTGKNAPDKHVTKPVAAKVIALGYATAHNGTLLTTKTGRAILNAVQPEDPPVFLRHRDGLTHLRHNAVQEAGEVVDPATLDTYWTEQSDRRKHEASDARTEARKLVARVKRAA